MKGSYTTRAYALTSAAPVEVGSELEDFSQFARNVQVHVEGLGAGTYKLEYRPPRANVFIEHVAGGTASDLTVLAGPNAPIFEALRISVSGTVLGSEQIAYVTAWHRGI